MASWRDNLRPASFRDATFKVNSSTRGGGRTWVIHDYPFKDAIYPESTGIGPIDYTMDAYVLGEDWIAKRDKLETACLADGAAILVHPTRGEILAVCTKCEVREETTKQGGAAWFSLAFTRADTNQFPAAVADTSAAVDAAAADAQAAVSDDFEDAFTVTGKQSVADHSAGLLDDLGETLTDAFAGPLAYADAAGAAINEVARFRTQALTLIRLPATLAARVIGLMSSLASLGSLSGLGLSRRRASTLSSLSAIGSWSDALPSVVGKGVVSQQAAANQTAIGTLVQQAAAITAAQVATETDYATYDDAAAARTAVAVQLDAARSLPGTSDNAFRALTALRTASVRDITDRGSSLSQISRVRLNATLPAEVVAYRLLGDADRADEIVSRNGVRHPGFVPGGVDLEVIDG